MKKGTKRRMVLATMLVSLGLFSYSNAISYVNGLDEDMVSEVLKTFQSISESVIQDKELISAGCEM